MYIFTKLIITCIIILLIQIVLKKVMPEYAAFISIISGLVITYYIVPFFFDIYQFIRDISNKIPDTKQTVSILIKLVGISLLCDFASRLCSDNGEEYLSSKITLGGKIFMIGLITPKLYLFVNEILEMIREI